MEFVISVIQKNLAKLVFSKFSSELVLVVFHFVAPWIMQNNVFEGPEPGIGPASVSCGLEEVFLRLSTQKTSRKSTTSYYAHPQPGPEAIVFNKSCGIISGIDSGPVLGDIIIYLHGIIYF